MKVLEKAIMPNGVEIQLEDWREHNAGTYTYGIQIAAYPIARNSSKYGLVVTGEKFRLTIASNAYLGYSDEHIAVDFEALKRGKKRLEDLSCYFWYGARDMFYLGMINSCRE